MTDDPLDTGWLDQAACRHEDPDLFFPVSAQGPGRAQAAEAMSVCGRCRVRDACLAYALATNQDSGIWGGLTEEERRGLRRRRRSPGGG